MPGFIPNSFKSLGPGRTRRVSALPIATFAALVLAPLPVGHAPVMSADRTSPSSVEAKIQALSDTTTRPGASYDPVTLTDAEANTYLKEHGPDFLPPAVQNPEVHINSDRVKGSADVDFDQLSQVSSGSDDVTGTILAAVFKGKQRVTADGRLDTANGQGKVTVENVAIGSTVIPGWLVQILLENYVQKKYNVDLSKPFVLPDHVTRIELAPGRATFIRSADKGR